MPDAQTQTIPAPARRRFLMRGESAIASAGLTVMALMVCVMIASVWWAQRTQRSAVREARERQVNAAAQLLAQSSELLLAEGELTAVRRMVADAARDNHFEICRIILPDGRILASSQPNESKLRDLPAEWESHPMASSDGLAAQNQWPLLIPGRGSAVLSISGGDTYVAGPNNLAAGVLAIGSVALFALLVLYRRMRFSMRGLGAVREALSALAGGESQPEALLISADLGPEVQAWNGLIRETERVRRLDLAEKAHEAVGRRQENKGELEAACDAISQGIILIDDQCRVRYANGAATVFLSSKREVLVGGDITKFLQVPDVLADVRAITSGSSRRRSTHDIERREEGNENGAVAGVLRFSVRPVRREDAGSAMITIEDITQQRVAEESRNRFVAQATHELRTPLTNIRLYIETAIDEGEENPATRAKCLNIINGETRRLERIVGEMLSVAEIEAGSFELRYDDVRVESLFEDLKSEFAPQAAEKNISLKFHLPPKFPTMQGDRDKITLAVHNLIANSLKYTQTGGRVEVSVEFANQQLAVQVKDTGIGISEEEQDKVFDRFYRAKDTRVSKITGTGLGLTLAREVVRLHGGDIHVDSKLDHGSTFTLTIPMEKKAA